MEQFHAFAGANTKEVCIRILVDTRYQKVMTERPLAIRLSDELIERLDRIADELSTRAAGARVSRSQAIRAGIERGVAGLEAELGLTTKKPKRKK